MGKPKTTVGAAKVAQTGSAPAEMDWSQYSGVTGMETVKNEDLGLPFLQILQGLSPELKKQDAKFILGAGQGDVINTLTREIVHVQGEEPVSFIPCAFQKMWMEWKPRDSGGGLVKAHATAEILAECTRNERGQDVLRSGNIIVTTAYFFGMRLVEGGEAQRCVIGLSSTQLKKSRTWLNMAMAIKVGPPEKKITPPLFSHIYQLETVGESNAHGEWYGWKVTLQGPVKDQMLITSGADIARQTISQSNRLLASTPAEQESEGGDKVY